MITNHIDKRLRDTFNNEKKNGAKNMEFPAELGKDPVDVVLFFISPHRLKGVDIEFLRHIQGRCSIIPILAKADTMTKDELAEFRSLVTTKLAEEGIEYYQGPYAVISAPLYNSSEYGQPGQPGGRVYRKRSSISCTIASLSNLPRNHLTDSSLQGNTIIHHSQCSIIHHP